MSVRMTPVVLALSLFAGTSLAADAHLGVWKLNEAKSKVHAGVLHRARGDRMKATVDGVDAEGKPTHNEWIGKPDGRDYPVTGDPSTDTRSLKRVDDHHYQMANKKDGKVTVSGSVAFTKDFKTRTLTLSGTDAKGKPVSGTWVYERQ